MFSSGVIKNFFLLNISDRLTKHRSFFFKKNHETILAFSSLKYLDFYQFIVRVTYVYSSRV